MPDLTIKLDGADVALRVDLAAAKATNAAFGSFVEGFRRIAELNYSAFVALTAIGTGKPVKDVEEAVFLAGMPDLVKPLSDYLARLANGGRPGDGELAA
jgi:hypothetical protein